MRRINNKAFTLIELAVVILVIGILAAIVLRNIGSTAIQARDTKRVGDLKDVTIYLAQYYQEYGYYPTTTATSNDSMIVGVAWNELGQALISAGIIQTMDQLPMPPRVSNQTIYYNYFPCTDNSNDYTLQNGSVLVSRADHFILETFIEESPSSNPQIYSDSIGRNEPNNWSGIPGWFCTPYGWPSSCTLSTQGADGYCIAE